MLCIPVPAARLRSRNAAAEYLPIERYLGQAGKLVQRHRRHLQGRSPLTPDEVIRLGPTRPIVRVFGEPPYLLHRVSYLTDSAYAGRFDANPLHLPHAAE